MVTIYPDVPELSTCQNHFFKKKLQLSFSSFDSLVLPEFSKPEASFPKLYFKKVMLQKKPPKNPGMEFLGVCGLPVTQSSVPSSSKWHRAVSHGEHSLCV